VNPAHVAEQHVPVSHPDLEHTIPAGLAFERYVAGQVYPAHVAEQHVLTSLPLHSVPPHKIVTGSLFNVYLGEGHWKPSQSGMQHVSESLAVQVEPAQKIDPASFFGM